MTKKYNKQLVSIKYLCFAIIFTKLKVKTKKVEITQNRFFIDFNLCSYYKEIIWVKINLTCCKLF